MGCVGLVLSAVQNTDCSRTQASAELCSEELCSTELCSTQELCSTELCGESNWSGAVSGACSEWRSVVPRLRAVVCGAAGRAWRTLAIVLRVLLRGDELDHVELPRVRVRGREG